MTVAARSQPGGARPPLVNDRSVDTGLALVDGPERARTGVVLLNMGGPDCLENVRPFLDNIFSDRDIIRLPGGRIGQWVLGRGIVRWRLGAAKENYRSIGGSSPLLRHTTSQARRLVDELEERTARFPAVGSVRVGIAMRYWPPFADEAVRAMMRCGVNRLIALPLYPHYTRATTGSSARDLRRACDSLAFVGHLVVVDPWYASAGYIQLWADRIEASLAAYSAERRRRVHLLASAHGLPQRLVDSGDPYVRHVQTTFSRVLEELRDPPAASLAFQSRAGPVRWIGPSTDDKLRELASLGCDTVLVWPISFVSDHIETLHELDGLLRHRAGGLGIDDYRVVPCFNDDPRFARVLADLIEPHLTSSALGKTEHS